MTPEELDLRINAIVSQTWYYGLSGLSAQIGNLVSDAITQERERCARVALDAFQKPNGSYACVDVAIKAIQTETAECIAAKIREGK